MLPGAESIPFHVPLHGGRAAGRVAIVDPEDAERVSAHRWFVDAQGYARTNLPRRQRATTGRTAITMHRLIMRDIGDAAVDHKNRDRLDNRRCNLRVATMGQNLANRGVPRHSRQPYKGVRSVQKRWQARIRHQGKEINLGSFVTPEEAAAAYDAAARHYFGEFALTNADISGRTS